MKTRTFDCVAMKRRGAERIYRELKDKTVEEQVEYWRARSRELQDWLVGRKTEARKDPPAG